MVDSITVSTILIDLPPSLNPYEAVRSALHEELFAEPSRAIRIAVFCSLGLVGVSLITSIACIVVRALRGEFWLYRLSKSCSTIPLVLPNTLLLWLTFNSLFAASLFPYVLLGAFKLHHSLTSTPIWSALVFVPNFLALWHVAWGTCASLFLQSARSSARSGLLAASFNVFFVLPALVAPVSMLTISALKLAAWTRGVAAYHQLDLRLGNWAKAFAGQGKGLIEPSQGGKVVLEGVPGANKLLDAMSLAFRGFESPYYICATFATLGAVLAAVAAFIQVLQLLRYSCSTTTPTADSWSPSHKKSDSASSAGSDTPMLPPAPLPSPVPQLSPPHKRLIVVLLTLALNGLTYAIVCLVGDLVITRSKIFSFSSSARVHLYLYMFVFAPLSFLVLLMVGFHTLHSPPPPTSPARPRPSISLPSPRSEPSIHEASLDLTELEVQRILAEHRRWCNESAAQEEEAEFGFEGRKRTPSLLPGMRISL